MYVPYIRSCWCSPNPRSLRTLDQLDVPSLPQWLLTLFSIAPALVHQILFTQSFLEDVPPSLAPPGPIAKDWLVGWSGKNPCIHTVCGMAHTSDTVHVVRLGSLDSTALVAISPSSANTLIHFLFSPGVPLIITITLIPSSREPKQRRSRSRHRWSSVLTGDWNSLKAFFKGPVHNALQAYFGDAEWRDLFANAVTMCKEVPKIARVTSFAKLSN